MIKKLLFAIMLALPMMGFAQSKFGVINSQTLMENMPEMKDVQTQLETASKKYEDEFKGLQDEFQKKYTELQSMEESTPQTIKDRRMKYVTSAKKSSSSALPPLRTSSVSRSSLSLPYSRRS